MAAPRRLEVRAIGEAMQDVAGRLDTFLSGGSSEFSAEDLDALHELAVASLADEALRRRLCALLLQCVAHMQTPCEPLLLIAVKLLWQIGCSISGSEVRVTDEPPDRKAAIGAPSTHAQDGASIDVGVLILGFAGANMPMLKLIDRIYHDLIPGCRVVTTVSAALDGAAAEASMRRQMERVTDALEPCAKVVVHAISNNGFWMWSELASSDLAPRIAPRLAATVYDCCAVPLSHYPDAALREVLKQTLLSVAFIFSLKPTLPPPSLDGSAPSFPTRVDAAVAAAFEGGASPIFNRRGTGETTAEIVEADRHAFDSHACSEPAVPALVLTSEEDEVSQPPSLGPPRPRTHSPLVVPCVSGGARRSCPCLCA